MQKRKGYYVYLVDDGKRVKLGDYLTLSAAKAAMTRTFGAEWQYMPHIRLDW